MLWPCRYNVFALYFCFFLSLRLCFEMLNPNKCWWLLLKLIFLLWLQWLRIRLDTYSGGITSNSTLPYWRINHFCEQLNFGDIAVFHFAARPESEKCWILISTQGHLYPGALPGWVCLLAVSSVPSQPLAPRAVSTTISLGQARKDFLPDAWVDE